MTFEETIQELFRRFTSQDRLYLEEGICSDLDELNRTITVTPEGEEAILNVKLQSDFAQDNGLCIFPKDGTQVTIGYLNKHSAILIHASEIDKIVFQNGSTKIEFGDKIIFNDGDNGGMIKIDSLISNIQERETRINNIVIALAALSTAMTALGAIPVFGTVLGAAITTALSPVIVPIVPTNKTLLENPDVLQ